MYIRMADGSDKSDCGRFVGISVWDYDVEFPEAICWFLVREWMGRVIWMSYFGMRCLGRL